VGLLALLDGLVVLVLDVVVVDDPQVSTKPKAARSRRRAASWSGSTSAIGSSRLRPRRLVASGAQVQVDPAALELELVDLALEVVVAAGLEGQDLQVAGEALELGQQVSDRQLRSVARQALYVVLS
jgi:hypothetical protein